MKNIIFIISLSLLAAACSESDTGSPKGPDSAAGQESKTSCIAGYADAPCSLFTAELVKNTYKEFPSEASKTEVKRISNCSYVWPSNGRTKTMEVMGRKMEIPLSNEISILWIKQKDRETALANFKRSYRTLSEDEKARAAETMQRVMKKHTDGLSNQQKDMASGISKGFLDNMKYESIAGIGNAAAWGGVGAGSSSLKVLDGDTEFELSVSISELEDDNKQLAMALAKSLITNCK